MQYQLVRKDSGKLIGKMRIIPIFLPHSGCKTMCSFCNEYSATGIVKKPDKSEIKEIVLEYRSYFKNKDYVELGFYGGTFTGNENATLKIYLDIAMELFRENLIHGIRFSTSPNEITDEKIKIIKEYPVKMIEIGVESFDEKVLKEAKRPHGVKDVYNSIDLIKKEKIPFGIHLMTDLPYSDYNKDLRSVIETVNLKPNVVRIHPTVVLKGSQLEKDYRENKYNPKSVDETVSDLWKFYVLINAKNIKISRIGICLYGEQKKSVVAGPYHESLGDIVKSIVYLNILEKIYLEKGRLKIPFSQKNIFTGYKKIILNNLEENKINYEFCETDEINIKYYIRVLASELLGGSK